MICFEDLVLEQLLTEALAPGSPYPLKNYYDDNTIELKEVTSSLTSKFSIINWPTSTTFLTVVGNATSRVNATPLVPFVKFFPLMDFLWFIADRVRGTDSLIKVFNDPSFPGIVKGSNPNEIQDDGGPLGGISREFVDSISGYADGSNPLFGYTPLSTTGVSYLGPLQRKYQSDFLGEFNLQTFDNFSLKRALYGLLEMRKKARSSTVNTNRIPQDVDWIDNILLEPQRYSGQTQIPPKLKELYDNASASQIIQIAKAFDSFFEAEKANAQMTSPALSGVVPDNTLSQFITNSQLKNNTFKFFFPTGGGAIGGQFVETPALAATRDGGYIISNIKLMDNSEPAKEVINLLQNFGNYISEGETPNIMSAMDKATSALRGLADASPNLGGGGLTG